MSDDVMDEAFFARRAAAREKLDQLTGAIGGKSEDRLAWFRTVYQAAEGDAAAIPWADLAPKGVLLDWLGDNPGKGRKAIDIACGLGDNAEALGSAGYDVTAFDLAPDAIEWARSRFPESPVDYRTADLFNLPEDWQGCFDLVHECYTVQALTGTLRDRALPAIAALVAPGGRLLMITRVRGEGAEAVGPPWPLMPSERDQLLDLGFSKVSEKPYEIDRHGRLVPHVIAEYRKD